MNPPYDQEKDPIPYAVDGPYVNGAPDSKPDGFPIPELTVEFDRSTNMQDVQKVIGTIQNVMDVLGFGDVRIECNFLQLADPGAWPRYNRKPALRSDEVSH